MGEGHTPVLLNEALDGLSIKPNGVYIDATFGRGGHSTAILKRLGPNGRLIALDKDPVAVEVGEKGPIQADSRFAIEHASFAKTEGVIAKRGLLGQVDGILMDLGVSSPQLDVPERGFSFLRDGPLDMRMDTTQGMDAATWIHTASQSDIQQVIRHYGEERFARRIATAIVEQRAQAPITTTRALAQVVADAVPTRERFKHPATRTFQAIRIFINRELEELELALPQCVNVLAPGGRLCVISFHSLEDRIVKQFIKRESQGMSAPRGLPLKSVDLHQRLKKVGKMIKPTAEETQQNARARSACLRIAERLS